MTSKSTRPPEIAPYDILQMHRSARFWLPKVLSFCEIAAWVVLAFAVISVVLVFSSSPLSYVVAVTDSGEVFNVPAR